MGLMKTVLMAFQLALASAALTAGFDLSNSLVPKDQILSGGPPPDGIPAILSPKFDTAEAAG